MIPCFVCLQLICLQNRADIFDKLLCALDKLRLDDTILVLNRIKVNFLCKILQNASIDYALLSLWMMQATRPVVGHGATAGVLASIAVANPMPAVLKLFLDVEYLGSESPLIIKKDTHIIQLVKYALFCLLRMAGHIAKKNVCLLWAELFVQHWFIRNRMNRFTL